MEVNQTTLPTNLTNPAALSSSTELTGEKRRFHAYNIGLPRTGTTSIAGIFGNFRVGHEFLDMETMLAITAYKKREIDEAGFERFVVDRDRKGNLEMDSSSYAAAYLPILVRRFPDAKFLFTIRDCWAWLNSTINLTFAMLAELPQWRIEYGAWGLGLKVNPEAFSSQDGFRKHLPDFAEGLLRYWAAANADALANLPSERSLVLKTNEIAAQFPAISKLVGVSVDELVSERSHIHKTKENYGLLAGLEDGLLGQLGDRYCRPLMNRYFPLLQARSSAGVSG
jgi:Sulfotransferase domain